MQKTLVIGSPGAGKSTLARQLGSKLRLPVISLDHLWWKPGWVERSTDEFDLLLAEELKKDQWVMEGNYNRTLPERLSRADTVIHLDYSRARCLWRIGKRTLITKNEQAPGCPSKADAEFLRYVAFKYPKEHRTRAHELRKAHPQVNWHSLRTPKEAKNWVSSL